jgi:hypothetical protein
VGYSRTLQIWDGFSKKSGYRKILRAIFYKISIIGLMQIHSTVVLFPVDVKNRNGRIYPKDVVERAIAKLTNGSINGTIGIPRDVIHPIVDPAFVAENIRVKDSHVIADIKVLTTESGRVLTSMLSEDPPLTLSYSPVGFGQINDDGKITDYQFTSIAVIQRQDCAFQT